MDGIDESSIIIRIIIEGRREVLDLETEGNTGCGSMEKDNTN